MRTSEWTARFIGPDRDFGGAPILRHRVVLARGHGPVVKAQLCLSALGVVEASIGGTPVSADLLTPGWTSHEWRHRYVEHDVTGLIAAPTFVLGLALGNGWYRGRLGWGEGAERYGEELAAFAQLTIRFSDGHVQVINTAADSGWTAGPSATTANDLYDGQDIDARAASSEWANVDFDESAWVGVHELDFDLSTLVRGAAPAIRRTGEFSPKRIWASPSGRTLVDFGQNLVGIVRVQALGPRGTTVTLRHAEVLERGEVCVHPLRGARATDRFTLSGGADRFEPTLTFHGFRYVEVDGWPGGIDAIDDAALTAVVIGSDLEWTGRFSSSNPMLNQLHENVIWSMRGNFVGVPTDCPQRDERLGWTGDIAVFAPTAVYLADVKLLLQDWLRDLAVEQADQGFVPLVVPDLLKRLPLHPFPEAESTAVWSDAAVWVPWALWEAYGDRGALRESYPSMLAHVNTVEELLSGSGVWESSFQLGDWLDPDADPHRPDEAKADKGVVATASLYRSVRMVACASKILGVSDEHLRLERLADRVRTGFHDRYVDDERISSDCPTVYAVAVMFDLLSASEKSWAGRRLAELVAASEFRISTGFAGTPYVLDALSQTGHLESAYRLLLQTQCPSWLYPVTMGATTIWERWDSMLPDGSINTGEMTSFNHYALGAVADWMHRVVGGLAPIEPGYTHVLIAPQPGGGLSFAETALMTPRGEVSVRWDLSGDRVTVVVALPAGVHATVRIPGRAEQLIGGGNHVFEGRLADSATMAGSRVG